MVSFSILTGWTRSFIERSFVNNKIRNTGFTFILITPAVVPPHSFYPLPGSLPSSSSSYAPSSFPVHCPNYSSRHFYFDYSSYSSAPSVPPHPRSSPPPMNWNSNWTTNCYYSNYPTPLPSSGPGPLPLPSSPTVAPSPPTRATTSGSTWAFLAPSCARQRENSFANKSSG